MVNYRRSNFIPINPNSESYLNTEICEVWDFKYPYSQKLVLSISFFDLKSAGYFSIFLWQFFWKQVLIHCTSKKKHKADSFCIKWEQEFYCLLNSFFLCPLIVSLEHILKENEASFCVYFGLSFFVKQSVQGCTCAHGEFVKNTCHLANWISIT